MKFKQTPPSSTALLLQQKVILQINELVQLKLSDLSDLVGNEEIVNSDNAFGLKVKLTTISSLMDKQGEECEELARQINALIHPLAPLEPLKDSEICQDGER